MMRLSHKMRKLTKELQKTENAQALQNRDIIKRGGGRGGGGGGILLMTSTIRLVRNFCG